MTTGSLPKGNFSETKGTVETAALNQKSFPELAVGLGVGICEGILCLIAKGLEDSFFFLF